MLKVLGLRGLYFAGLVVLLLGSGCGDEAGGTGINGVKEGGGQFTPPPFGFSATTTAIVTPEIIIAPQDRDAAAMNVACGDGVLGGDEVCDPAIHPCCNATCDGVLDAETVCNESTGACDPAEVCDGDSFMCPEDALAETGTECRPSAGACDAAETCDGVSNECPPDGIAEPGAICRESVGDCDVEEICDGTSLECPPDVFAVAETVCRDAEGVCDVAEVCTGDSAQCPEDLVEGMDEAAPVLCRQANVRSCDLPEYCDGENKECPEDLLVEAGTTCQGAIDSCDRGEICDGVSPDCPPATQTPAPRGTPCRPVLDVNKCDVAEFCDGTLLACPRDRFAADTVTCRDAEPGGCDIAEMCTGTGPACPTDVVRPANTPCRSSDDLCDVAETCGGSNRCPADGFAARGTPCRAAADPLCDVAETCTGNGAACPADVVRPVGTPCRGAVNTCDVAEACNGSNTCPTDAFASTTTVCRVAADLCDAPDTCVGGAATCEPDARIREGGACNSNLGTCSDDICCPGMTTNNGRDQCDIDGNNLVFVSSSSSNGSFGGFANADTECNKLADDANLAGTYRAWLSAPNAAGAPVDATSRVTGGGPFLLVNGAMVGTNVSDLLDRDGPDREINITQWNQASRATQVWTGTNGSGAYSDNACGTWNATTANGTVGDPQEHTSAWTNIGTPASCATTASLYCFQQGCFADTQTDENNCGACGTRCATTETCIAGRCGAYAFVTSRAQNGGFGGVENGDTICNTLAAAANRPGTFVAWLSANANSSAFARILDTEYYRFDNRRIAAGRDAMVRGGLENPINVRETGVTVPTAEVHPVWTGTSGSGTFVQPNCSTWTDGARGTGVAGNLNAVDASWSNANPDGERCADPGLLYCFQVTR